MKRKKKKLMALDKVAFEAAFKAAVQPVLDQFQVNLGTVDALPVAQDEDKFTVNANPVVPKV